MNERDHLILLAQRMRREARGALPCIFAFTDPSRTPNPLALAAALPQGAVIVYRHFGAPDRLSTAMALRKASRRERIFLLIGADAALARRVRADGVHLPERLASQAGRLRRAHPRWLVTAAAHNRRALAKAANASAILISPIFPSHSPSAGRPLGLLRAQNLARLAPAPSIALGGVNAKTARRLVAGRAFAGIAAIEGLAPEHD